MGTETTEDGWKKTTLADRQTIGTSAIVAQRWSFEPLAGGPEQIHGDTDQLLYVISGSGRIRVNNDPLPLEVETVVWLESGDKYHFTAAENGLEVLQGYAPGE
jgi:quercetin dioxygenase-like cupin family protein